MIKVRTAEFSDEYKQGDGIVTYVNDSIGIFYSHGIILNDKYIVCDLRFLKDKKGDREINLLEQHKNVPLYIYGSYNEFDKKEKIFSHFLNGFEPPWQIVTIDNILVTLKGEDTFQHNCKKYKFSQKLSEIFPNTMFSEVGSSNVGLNTNDSDIDIFIFNNYKSVTDILRVSPNTFGLKINESIYKKEINEHRKLYGFSEEKAKRVCNYKLSGLEFDYRKVDFFNANKNELLRKIFQPNCSKQIKVKGEVISDKFAGHHIVFYSIQEDEKYHVALIRGIFIKEKRYILQKGDFTVIDGTLVHKDPNIIIANDLNLIN